MIQATMQATKFKQQPEKQPKQHSEQQLKRQPKQQHLSFVSACLSLFSDAKVEMGDNDNNDDNDDKQHTLSLETTSQQLKLHVV